MQKQVEYTEAVKSKYPEQVVIAIARDRNGIANPITLGWTMIVSSKPPMMAIAVAKTHYSVEAIEFSQCFTLVYPSVAMAKAALFYGSKSGRKVDKFQEFPSELAAAVEIDSVLMTDAVANFECQLESQMIAGDHVIYVANVVASHINTEPAERLYTVGAGHKLGGVCTE